MIIGIINKKPKRESKKIKIEIDFKSQRNSHSHRTALHWDFLF